MQTIHQQETKINEFVESRKTVKPIQNNKTLLELLFKDKPSNQKIMIWCKGNERKISTYFSDWQTAQKFAESQKDLDVYFGLCTSTEVTPQDKRIKADEVCGINCFWIDVDIADESHKSKKKYPPSANDALALIKQIPLPASLVVNSGKGFHAYWIFSNFQIIDNEQTRSRIANLSEQWQQLIRDKAKVNNFEIDSTQDLARILRVTNTFNLKNPDEPKEVKIVKINKHRYSLEDFEKHTQNIEIKPKSVLTKSDVKNNYDGELREDAEPNARKLDLLLENNENFSQGWKFKRDDLGGDASSYELSFANFITQAKWTFQEFLDLCVAFRRRHKLTPKAEKNSNALEYYKNTWHKAQIDYRASQKTQDEKRKVGIEYLREELHLINLVKVGLRGETFELHLTDKIIVLGSAENLFSQTKIRARLLLERIKFDRKFDSTKWQQIVDAITDSFEVIETHTDAQEIMDLVIRHTQKALWRDYFFDNADYPSKEFDEAVEQIREKGFFDKKSITVYLSLSFFASWVNHPVRRYTQKELAALLGRNDFVYKQKTIRVTDKDSKTSTINLGRFYVSPKDYFKDEVNFLSKLEV